MRLGELLVNRAPVAAAPGNAVGIKNVAIQIALGILQRHLIHGPQVRAIVGQQSLNVLVQNRFSDSLADFAKIPARIDSVSGARFLSGLPGGERNQPGNYNEARDGHEEDPRGRWAEPGHELPFSCLERWRAAS